MITNSFSHDRTVSLKNEAFPPEDKSSAATSSEPRLSLSFVVDGCTVNDESVFSATTTVSGSEAFSKPELTVVAFVESPVVFLPLVS